MAKFNSAKDSFLVQHTDFSLREQVKYPNGGQSRFYDNGTDMVIIDEDICTHDCLLYYLQKAKEVRIWSRF